MIDDEAAIRRALLRLMRSAGIRARAFASGAEFLAHLAQDVPVCVVLDLYMPGMSGFELQVKLAELAPGMGIVVTTGHHSAEVQARAMLTRPLAYLLKPMNDQLLLDAVAAAIEQA